MTSRRPDEQDHRRTKRPAQSQPREGEEGDDESAWIQGQPANDFKVRDWRVRWQMLVGKIHHVPNAADEAALLAQLTHPVASCVLAFVNAHALNSVASSPGFFQALQSADLLLRDGSGVALLLKWLGLPPGMNMNGTDLIPRLLRGFNGRGIALLGTQDPYLRRGVQTVARELAPDSALVSAHGFLRSADYLALLRTHRPALVVLGMGMPRQEQVAAELRAQLAQAGPDGQPLPCLIVCGGAIIDFLGGRTPRAPPWMRRAGFEWLFRLAMEPRRLFQRYVVGNPLFLWRTARCVFSHSKGSG